MRPKATNGVLVTLTFWRFQVTPGVPGPLPAGEQLLLMCQTAMLAWASSSSLQTPSSVSLALAQQAAACRPAENSCGSASCWPVKLLC